MLLRRLLRRELLSTAGLAILLGVSAEQVSRYERGDDMMSLALAERLAQLALRFGASDAETRRRATALHNQVVATRAYEAGSTISLSNAPTLPWW